LRGIFKKISHLRGNPDRMYNIGARSHYALSTAASHLHPFDTPTTPHWTNGDTCTTNSPITARLLQMASPAASQLAQLPMLVRHALHAASHAELLRLWPTDRVRALLHSISTRPGSK
jgi:hypothetical protein